VMAPIAAVSARAQNSNLSSSQQAETAVISVPWTGTPPAIDCSLVEETRPGDVILSKETGTLLSLNPPNVLTTAPPEIRQRWDSFRASYRFQWDEHNFYGTVQVSESEVDNQYPEFSVQPFLKSESGGFFPDLLYDSVTLMVSDLTKISIDATHQPERYTTEMHLYVRPPAARKPEWTFLGRTTDEEDFHELGGNGVACQKPDGYLVKFAVSWLPSRYWQPTAEAHANIKLIAPFPVGKGLSMEQRATKAYALQRAIDITLQK
jgi:hypothetical protein